MKRLTCLGIALALILAASALPTFAQSKLVVVQRRDGDITILPSGAVEFVETWQVQFIGGPFRSAYRSIPLNRVFNITDWGITEASETFRMRGDAAAYTFTISTDKDNQTIKWYFPETTDQTRTFVLRYTLKGALRIDPKGDQLYWHFIEKDRQYTINAARVLLHLPATFDTGQLKATCQHVGEQAGARILDGQTIEFTGGPFAPGVEWEILAEFPPGAVPASPPPWQMAESRQPNLVLPAVIAALVAGGGLLGFFLLRRARVPKSAIVVTADGRILPSDAYPGQLSEETHFHSMLSFARIVDWVRHEVGHVAARPGWIMAALGGVLVIAGILFHNMLGPLVMFLIFPGVWFLIVGLAILRTGRSGTANQPTNDWPSSGGSGGWSGRHDFGGSRSGGSGFGGGRSSGGGHAGGGGSSGFD